MKKNNKKGFTLAELLIVVAIIAVLVAIAIPIFTNQLEKSREATDAANIRDVYAEVAVAMLTDGLDQDGATASVGGLTATTAVSNSGITVTVDEFPVAQKVDNWQTGSINVAGAVMDTVYTVTDAGTGTLTFTFKVDGNDTYLDAIALVGTP